MNDVNRFCHHCGNLAPHTLLLSQLFDDPHYGDNDEEYEVTSGLYVLRCETCRGLSVYYELEPGEKPNWPDASLQWPKSTFLGVGTPPAIQHCYEEAVLVKHRAPNAFAVLIRRALEAICDHRGAAGRSLFLRLRDLAAKGEIPPTLAKMSAVLRTLGNAGAHIADAPVRRGDVYMIDSFFRAVVEYVYIGPRRIADFEAQSRRRNEPEFN